MIVLAILALVMGLVVGPRVMKMFGESKVDIATADGQEVRLRGVPVVVAVAPRQGLPRQARGPQRVHEQARTSKDPWGTPYKMLCGREPAAGREGHSPSCRPARTARKAPPTTSSRGSSRDPRPRPSHPCEPHDAPRRHRTAGMTVLELMIVLAIIGGGRRPRALGVPPDHQGGSRRELDRAVRGAASATSQLAIENGELHRVVLISTRRQARDLRRRGVPGQRGDRAQRGAAPRRRGDQARARARQAAAARPADRRARRRRSGRGDEARDSRSRATTSRIARARRRPRADHAATRTGKRRGPRAARRARASSSRRSGSSTATTASTKGQVAIYFFPTGSSEKAVIEMTDGSETFTVARATASPAASSSRDGALRDVNDHMLRNVMGDKDAKRDGRRQRSDEARNAASRCSRS